jgi:hypothetical protein
MRTRDYLEAITEDRDELVAYFGSARLVRTPNGRLEVRGGTETDQAEARGWVARFLTPPPESRGRYGRDC